MDKEKLAKEIETVWFWNWNLTFKEIAKMFNVSVSKVSRIIKKSIYY